MYARSIDSWVTMAIQPAKGTFVNGTVIAPLAGGESVEPQMDIQYSEVPDGQIYDVWSVERGRWFQGDIPLFLHPGIVKFLSQVIAIQSDRQPPYLSVSICFGSRYFKGVRDARVTSARFSFSRRDLPQMTLTILGIPPADPFPLDSLPSFPSMQVLLSPPFTRSEILTYLANAPVLDIPDGSFFPPQNRLENFFIQSLEATIDFNPIDANELIPFGQSVPADVLTTVVRVTGNLTVYATMASPAVDVITNIVTQRAPFALGLRMQRGTIIGKLVLRNCVPERISANISGDKTSLEQISIDFRAIAPIIGGTVYAPYAFTVTP